MTPERDEDLELAQRERARREWVLCVTPEEAEPGQRDPVEKIRRVLRLKRFEAEELRRRLPGVVRSGARVDLAPLLEALQAAGVSAELRRRNPGE